MIKLSPEEFTQRYGDEALESARVYRRGFQPQPQNTPLADVTAGFNNAKQAFQSGLDRDLAIESENRSKAGEFFGKFTGGIRTAGEMAGSLAEGAFRALPGGDTVVNTIGNVIGGGVTAAANNPVSRGAAGLAKSGFNSLPTGVRQTLGDTANAVAGGAQLAGLLTLPGVTNTSAKAFLRSADDVLTKTKAAQIKFIPEKGFMTNAVNNARYQLSDIDPQVETILQRSTVDEVDSYFNAARAAKADPAKATPLELAGNKAEEAYDAIDKARIEAIQAKNAILSDVSSTRVSGSTINNVMSAGIQRMNQRYGISISANGKITNSTGRLSKLDAADSKLVTEYFQRMNSLGVSPTVQQVDDFVDWAQSQLYKQDKTLSKLDSADKAVISDLKQITGDLNSRLKTEVGGGYGEVNAKISEMIELQDELSRALGADARKGASLMKRLFSPTSGNVRANFTRVQEMTGIDLFKEATLAKYAMESVGDVRQRSLLQSLDIAVTEAADLDLTKPLSLVKFIRERADMDGEELAKEIIRRSNQT